jgi:hypothetical protein
VLGSMQRSSQSGSASYVTGKSRLGTRIDEDIFGLSLGLDPFRLRAARTLTPRNYQIVNPAAEDVAARRGNWGPPTLRTAASRLRRGVPEVPMLMR